MDILAAYQRVGSFRGAAAICGTTHKTVARVVAAHESASGGAAPPPRKDRVHNYDPVAAVVAKQIEATKGRITAKRLLPIARAEGYAGSARNFRRLVAEAKLQWRRGHYRGRRPGVWAPGEHLVIDWGVLEGVHVFCAVLAWSRWRFVRFAADEKATTTLGLLAECFEALGGVPKVVLADRMGCLKGGVVANVVVPAPDYVRFATHYGFRPDFCNAADPESKGIVEHLVGYAKSDLMIPQMMGNGLDGGLGDLGAANLAAKDWCAEVNAAQHSEICAVPAERLAQEQPLLGLLPSLRLSFERATFRKVDTMSCIRIGSARYSVPNSAIGTQVQVLTGEGKVRILAPITGELLAEHGLVAPGEVSILDEHYGSSRPDRPRRAPRGRTAAEKEFLALGPVAADFLTGAAAAGVARLAAELPEITALAKAHGHDPLIAALERAVAFRRWRAADVRSILAAGTGVPVVTPPGADLILTLPTVPTRSLSDYAIATEGGSGVSAS